MNKIILLLTLLMISIVTAQTIPQSQFNTLVINETTINAKFVEETKTGTTDVTCDFISGTCNTQITYGSYIKEKTPIQQLYWDDTTNTTEWETAYEYTGNYIYTQQTKNLKTPYTFYNRIKGGSQTVATKWLFNNLIQAKEKFVKQQITKLEYKKTSFNQIIKLTGLNR